MVSILCTQNYFCQASLCQDRLCKNWIIIQFARGSERQRVIYFRIVIFSPLISFRWLTIKLFLDSGKCLMTILPDEGEQSMLRKQEFQKLWNTSNGSNLRTRRIHGFTLFLSVRDRNISVLEVIYYNSLFGQKENKLKTVFGRSGSFEPGLNSNWFYHHDLLAVIAFRMSNFPKAWLLNNKITGKLPPITTATWAGWRTCLLNRTITNIVPRVSAIRVELVKQLPWK